MLAQLKWAKSEIEGHSLFPRPPSLERLLGSSVRSEEAKMDKLTVVGKHDARTIAKMHNCLETSVRYQAFFAPTDISAMPSPLAA